MDICADKLKLYCIDNMITKVFGRTFATAGRLMTWGETTYGWGRETNNNLRVPGRVEGFDDVVEVATGPYHMLLRTSGQEIFSVGLGDNGRLGNGSSNSLETPEPIEALNGANITQISAGWNHSLALSGSGDVYSWGFGGYSNPVLRALNFFSSSVSPLGHEGLGDVTTPKVIEGLAPVSQIAAGKGVSFALAQSGELYGWGDTSASFSEASSSTPILLNEINYFLHKHHANVLKIASSGSNGFLLLDNGRLYAIGRNNGGVFGTRNNPKTITDNFLTSLTKVVDEDYSNERIVDFKVSGNSLVFITDSGAVFYSGMHNTFRPERFPLNEQVRSIFATYDSVGVIGQSGQISFINDAFIEDSMKKGKVMVNLNSSLNNAFDIGGSHKLRYALVGN